MKELNLIIAQLTDAYGGQPWFGRSVKSVLTGMTETVAFEKPAGQHSALELLWHMITWREFVIDRLQHSPQMQLEYFEKNDWRILDHSDISLWKQGMERLDETQVELLSLLKSKDDSILDMKVEARDFDFRYMLYGFIQHDIYHLGQIAYIGKLLKKQE
jgi:uncharacterized damage-inducible protein DinB